MTNNAVVLGAYGTTTGQGYAVDARAGKLFPLVDTLGMSFARLVSAPPTTPGGYAVFLDASGHLGYRRERDNAFTDSAGLVTGAEELSYGVIGARARLTAVIPDRGFPRGCRTAA